MTPSWITCRFSRAVEGDAKDPQTQSRLLLPAGLSLAQLITMKQVHGDHVSLVENASQNVFPKTDGLITAKENIALGVFTADCMPILLWEEKQRLIGALHAGWRGAAKKILSRAIELMQSRWKIKPSNIHLSIGPHIQNCCYAVGEDVAGHFPQECLKRSGGKIYLSLGRAALLEASQIGILQSQVGMDPSCTHCSPDFFSFRRDETAQRMLSYIVKINP